jgi:hypothetical protein
MVAQSVSNFDNNDILTEDNIYNVVHLLDKKSQFANTLVTNHDVRSFFKRKDRKYRQICELAELSYVYYFSLLRIVFMRHDYVETTH